MLFDPGAPRKIDPADFRSHTKNSPFVGRLMQGRVLRTVVAGKTVFEARQPVTGILRRSLAFVGGYLLGSIPFAFVVTKAFGLGDIRQVGSGNVGATNVLRTGNRSPPR